MELENNHERFEDGFDGYLTGRLRSTGKVKSNLESAWNFIAGGINAHPNGSYFNKYGITHILRQIDGFHTYPPTLKLRETMQRLNIEIPDFWCSQDRTKYNLLLKKNGVVDTIQIEHLNGGVKHFIERILHEKNHSGLILNAHILASHHAKYTRCCYKLKSEVNLNENVQTDDENLRLFFTQL